MATGLRLLVRTFPFEFENDTSENTHNRCPTRLAPQPSLTSLASTVSARMDAAPLSDTTLAGACHCGALAYTTTSLPTFSGYCHCEKCQRLTGWSIVFLNMPMCYTDGRSTARRSFRRDFSFPGRLRDYLRYARIGVTHVLAALRPA